MRTVLASIALSIVLSSCSGVERVEKQFVYGPRWVDYEEWSQLQFGLPRESVLQILGEPYLPKHAFSDSQKGKELLIFKIRTKYYRLKEETKIILEAPRSGKQVSSTSFQGKDQKPAKFAKTDVWGEMYTLVCVFDNGKLAEWYCLELLGPQADEVAQDSTASQSQ